MKIELSPEVEQIIKDRVATGHYQNASEFIREAILKAVERDQLKLHQLNEEIAIGIEEAETGQFSKRSVQDIIRDKETKQT